MSSSTSARIIPVDHSVNYWDRYCDPRTVDFWLISNGPWKLATFTGAYLAIVFIGQRWMRTRKPYELRTPMFIYNIILVTINGYFLFESLLWINFGIRLFDFKFPSSQDRSVNAMHIVHMFYYYQWTKFIDYFDTFFFILRKKDRQLTALHIYHHISVPIIGWISSWTNPTMPVLGLFAMLNCFCHVIMYTYYALSSFGEHIQPYLWWKHYITRIQLTQFAIIGTYGICLQLFHTGYPLLYRTLPISQAIIFLYMFGQFYIRSYYRNNNNNNRTIKQKNQ
ncbi:fatty acid elongase 1-like protein [Dermatophagoides farinae]|uniref:Elongation of very long chain fatty acids protein n=1 Tax=Dermatophagoides farinae TaxID=6954 RepID=A0A9D4SHW2_DERFA|nr:elongation of very long chain fatty acids protein 4-like [Dermatophagoides farinae]KAH7643089.1 fatty acid elongase 1-like protein [Dermatophagoides farinae]